MKKFILAVFILQLPFWLMSQTVMGETVREWLERGYYSQINQSPEETLRYYEEGLREYANEELLYLYRGKFYWEQGNLDSAFADLTKAIELSPNLAGAYELRGKVKEAKGDSEGAKKDFAKAKEEHAKEDYALYRLNRELSADPQNADIHWKIANYKQNRGDNAGAIKSFDKYLEFSDISNKYFAYWYRANAKAAIGDTDGALADYNLLIEKFPNNRSGAYEKRARFKESLGDIEGAEADELAAQEARREKIIKEIQQLNDELKALDAQPPEIHAKLTILERIADNQMEIESYADVVTTLDKAIALQPSSSLLELRAKAKKAMGDMEGYQADFIESRWIDNREKLKLLNKTLEENPHDVNALVERAQLWRYVRDYSKALVDTNKALEIEASLIEALKIRAISKKELGDIEGSWADRRLIGQLKQNNNK